MEWRKVNRWLHRELGYLFFGMSIIYGISGIALNHGVARHWDPGLISKSADYSYPDPLSRQSFGRQEVERVLEITGERRSYKQFYFPDDRHAMLYLKGGHIVVDLLNGDIRVTRIRNRPVFNEMNYLHYNKPKKLWTWFSDLFALSLIVLAVTGLFLVRGKKGLRGRGGILTLAGIIIPLAFLALYLWF